MLILRGKKGNLTGAGNLADSNISETINDTKQILYTSYSIS